MQNADSAGPEGVPGSVAARSLIDLLTGIISQPTFRKSRAGNLLFIFMSNSIAADIATCSCAELVLVEESSSRPAAAACLSKSSHENDDDRNPDIPSSTSSKKLEEVLASFRNLSELTSRQDGLDGWRTDGSAQFAGLVLEQEASRLLPERRADIELPKDS